MTIVKNPVSLLVVSLSWLLALTGGSANATTIVVARTAAEIVIGADSKVTDAYGNELNRRACKILQIGNLLIAMQGLEVDRDTGFSVPEIATTALQLKPSASVTEKVSILTGFLVTRLFRELAYFHKRDPKSYSQKFEGGRVFLKIVIAAFEKGRPLLFMRSFRAIQLSTDQVGVGVLPDDCVEDCPGTVVTRFLGETEAIDGLPEETPGFWQDGLVGGVRRLIETEIAARSEYVGPPIDIVRIDKSGIQWIQKKPECGASTERKTKRPAVGKKRN